jgi:hypothetical protein
MGMDEPYRASATPDHEREVALAKRLEELRGTDGERAELEVTLRELQAQAQKKRLQLLGSVTIAAPCSANWQDMHGDNTKRFCGSCEKHVFNLSAMTEVQAAHFIETEKTACVRFYQRKDGTILTQDCPVGIKIRKRRNRIGAALAAGLGLAGAMGLASAALRVRPPTCILRATTGEPPLPEVMGSFAPEPEAPPPPKEVKQPGYLQGGVGPVHPAKVQKPLPQRKH